jgi:hypothetical protein
MEHAQTDVAVVLTVADALALKEALPQLLQLLDNSGARNPEDRESQRQAEAAIRTLRARLHESLRPFDVPGTSPPHA